MVPAMIAMCPRPTFILVVFTVIELHWLARIWNSRHSTIGRVRERRGPRWNNPGRGQGGTRRRRRRRRTAEGRGSELLKVTQVVLRKFVDGLQDGIDRIDGSNIGFRGRYRRYGCGRWR